MPADNESVKTTPAHWQHCSVCGCEVFLDTPEATGTCYQCNQKLKLAEDIAHMASELVIKLKQIDSALKSLAGLPKL